MVVPEVRAESDFNPLAHITKGIWVSSADENKKRGMLKLRGW